MYFIVRSSSNVDSNNTTLKNQDYIYFIETYCKANQTKKKANHFPSPASFSSKMESLLQMNFNSIGQGVLPSFQTGSK